MKNINYILGCTLFSAAMLTSSCVDDSMLDFQVDKPAVIAELEYLNDYDFLKTYVNRTTDPNFKLGAALSAKDYNTKGLIYRLANSNFDEITAGNEMKYSEVVGDNGAMNFSTVSAFVKAAQEAGISIYGHTLAWHAQQNNKYLNSLLADKPLEVEEGATQSVLDAEFDYSKMSSYSYWGQDPAGASRALVDGVLQIKNPTSVGFWEHQYHVADGITWLSDLTYTVTMMIRASAEASITVVAGTWDKSADGKIDVGTDWKEISIQRTPGVTGGGFVMFQSGNFAGTIELKSLKVTHEEALATSWWTSIITNGDAEGTDGTNFVSTHVGSQNGPAAIVDGVGKNDSRAFVVTSAGGGVNSWDTQFFLYTQRKLKAGDKVKVAFDYKADVANKSESQVHSTPGGYIHYDGGCAVSFTSDWQHFEKTIVITSTLSPTENMQTFAWNLDVGVPNAPANKYYFDNIEFAIEETGTGIPLTAEEKRDTLLFAMNNWVKGMMEACGGYVTSWDVVNEPISGVDKDNDGIYDLQSAKNVSSDDAKNNFYWQDYLGDTLYVRAAVSAARKYFAEYEGDPAKLKLFINDYNLESDWDNNQKLKSLIAWIGIWESDKVTKIDGIGTQMHISYYANAATQKSKEDHIVEMFKIMATTGKLIKISELDMGYVDENGNTIHTDKLTNEQHQAMANFYKFIVKKYFELIPANQRYGITQWCLTDSPEGSGWRAGEPTGLWDVNYYRKHAYAGIADGLSGK